MVRALAARARSRVNRTPAADARCPAGGRATAGCRHSRSSPLAGAGGARALGAREWPRLRVNGHGRSGLERAACVGRVPVLGNGGGRPEEDVARVDGREIYAAVRATATEIVVPIGGVK